MNLTKRQINKKLKSKILKPLIINNSNEYLQNFKIIVTRARRKVDGVRGKTLVTVKVSGKVMFGYDPIC